MLDSFLGQNMSYECKVSIIGWKTLDQLKTYQGNSYQDNFHQAKSHALCLEASRQEFIKTWLGSKGFYRKQLWIHQLLEILEED